jgi:hypothetical protein
MKLNRLFIASLLGFSMLTTSALACDHSSGSSSTSSQESHWSFFGWNHNSDADSRRESDMNGQNTGTGRNCDHGKGNGGGYCGTDGSTSSGGTSTGSTGGTSSGGSTGKGISN